MNNYEAYYAQLYALAKEALSHWMETQRASEPVRSAMNYSLGAGGKRLRPMLVLAGCDLLQGDRAQAMGYACAIEMIHTYSLIHDDMPAMDNDDYRRGKLTCHKVYGEGMAILAGDGLLNSAFEVMAAHMQRFPENLPNHIRALAHIARGAGIEGMIAGQCVDLVGTGDDAQSLTWLHRHKTGALITAALLAGLQLAAPTPEQLEALREFGYRLGLQFQIVDDLLDVEGDAQTLGKATGSDAANQKTTYVTLYGSEKARELAREHSQAAVEALEIFGERAWFLRELTMRLLTREQ